MTLVKCFGDEADHVRTSKQSTRHRRRKGTSLSSLTLNTKKPTKRRGIIAGAMVAIGAALLGAALFAPASGAYFTATSNGSADVKAANLSLDLGDAHGSQHTFALQFNNLAPGAELTDQFTVKNSGSITADVSATATVTGRNGQAAALNQDQLNQLQFYVEGFSGWQSFSNASATLGSLPSGSSYTYTVHVRLDPNADNSWQNAEVVATIPVTLTQQH